MYAAVYVRVEGMKVVVAAAVAAIPSDRGDSPRSATYEAGAPHNCRAVRCRTKGIYGGFDGDLPELLARRTKVYASRVRPIVREHHTWAEKSWA